MSDEKLFFDDKLKETFKEAAHQAFLSVPELRSVVITFDYYRELNDAPDITKGLWLSSDGQPVKKLDAVIGSIGATLQGVAHMFDDLFTYHQAMKQEITQLTQQLLEARQEQNK